MLYLTPFHLKKTSLFDAHACFPHTHTYIYIYIYIYILAGDRSWGWSEGSLFNSYNTKVERRALLLSLDCSTLPSICTLYCWVLSKKVSSSIFKVFGMTWPGIEPRSPRPLANTLPFRPIYIYIYSAHMRKIKFLNNAQKFDW